MGLLGFFWTWRPLNSTYLIFAVPIKKLQNYVLLTSLVTIGADSFFIRNCLQSPMSRREYVIVERNPF